MTDSNNGYHPRVGAFVEYNLSASLVDPQHWHYATVTCANVDGTYDVVDRATHTVQRGDVQPPAGKSVQQVVVGDLVLCQEDHQWYAGRVASLARDSGEDSNNTDEILSFQVQWVHRGVRADQLRPAKYLPLAVQGLVAIYPLAMLCVLFIAMILCTDNQKSRDETGESPRSPFAVITPSGCNPAVGRTVRGTPLRLPLHDMLCNFMTLV